MKKTFFLALCMLYFCSMQAFAQITKENLIGRWALVDFDMEAKNKKKTLTKQEVETVQMMKQALKAQPKFMAFNFNEDGTFLAEPKTDDSDGNATWKLKKNIVSLTSGKKKKTEQYTLRLLANGNIEFKAVKSLIAIPVLTFEKD